MDLRGAVLLSNGNQFIIAARPPGAAVFAPFSPSLLSSGCGRPPLSSQKPVLVTKMTFEGRRPLS